jgi:hypothetical protein
LPVQQRPWLTATVANGEKVSCPGVIRQAPISINGMKFLVDIYVMPLAGYDMVLGTQWTATLGRIAWDSAVGTMVFQQQGREVCWRGVAQQHGPALHAATDGDSLLDGLLGSFTEVFGEPTGLPPPRARDHHIVLKPSASRWQCGRTGTRRRTRTS